MGDRQRLRALRRPEVHALKVLNRLRQVLYFLRPSATDADFAWAHGWLNEAQRALFDGLSLQDRAHLVRVARRLEAQQAPAYALEAALLHDAGKPPGFGLVGRCLGVLLASRLDGLPARPRLGGLRGQLQIYRWHDQWGLEAARGAGTSEAAMALLAAYVAHEKAGAPAWLEPLRRADDLG